MIVVSDTSPLNYLILIDRVSVLPALFGQVLAPPAVIDEMSSPRAPARVASFVGNRPAWLEVRAPAHVPADLMQMGAGEREAIALAMELPSTLLLVDDFEARTAAELRGIVITGTLGLIRLAGKRGLIDVRHAIAQLRSTSIRLPQSSVDSLLEEFLPS